MLHESVPLKERDRELRDEKHGLWHAVRDGILKQILKDQLQFGAVRLHGELWVNPALKPLACLLSVPSARP